MPCEGSLNMRVLVAGSLTPKGIRFAGRIFNFTEQDHGQYNDTRKYSGPQGLPGHSQGIFHKLGGFDESFFAHMEEIDLCWKIHRMGKLVYYCGTSTIYHVGAGTLSRSNPRKTYYNFRNGLSLIYKHLPSAQLWYKLPLRILLDLLAAFKFIIEGHGRDGLAVNKALIDFIKSVKNTQRERAQLRAVYPHSYRNIYQGLISLTTHSGKNL